MYHTIQKIGLMQTQYWNFIDYAVKDHVVVMLIYLCYVIAYRFISYSGSILKQCTSLHVYNIIYYNAVK